MRLLGVVELGQIVEVIWVSLLAAGTFFALFLAAGHRTPGAALPRVARASVWTERVRRGELVRQVLARQIADVHGGSLRLEPRADASGARAMLELSKAR